MKKFIFAASSTALALSSLAGPASAQEIQEFLAPTVATFVDPNPELSAMCKLKPNTASGFVAVALNGTTLSSSETIDDPLGVITVTPNGTPTIVRSFARAHVNGQSVNIHADITEVAKYASSTRHIPRITVTTTTTSFDCHVHKPTNGNNQEIIHPGFQIAPDGLQGDPVSTSTTSSASAVERTVLGGPIEITTLNGEEGVICISPTKTPGTWRNANSYGGQLGACSRSWHDMLGLSQPTASIPAP